MDGKCKVCKHHGKIYAKKMCHPCWAKSRREARRKKCLDCDTMVDPYSLRCNPCNVIHLHGDHRQLKVCECGKPKGYRSRRCWSCATATRVRTPRAPEMKCIRPVTYRESAKLLIDYRDHLQQVKDSIEGVLMDRLAK